LPDTLTNVHEPIGDLFAVEPGLLHKCQLALVIEVWMVDMLDEPFLQNVFLPVLEKALFGLPLTITVSLALVEFRAALLGFIDQLCVGLVKGLVIAVCLEILLLLCVRVFFEVILASWFLILLVKIDFDVVRFLFLWHDYLADCIHGLLKLFHLDGLLDLALRLERVVLKVVLI